MSDEDNLGLQFHERSSLSRGVLWIAAIALLYFVAARFSLWFVIEPEGIAAVWPPTGIFLSAVLLTRRDLRPWLVGVLLIVDFVAEIMAGTPVIVSSIYALVVSVDAMLSAWLLYRFVGKSITFGRVREVAGWLGLSVVFSSALTSLVAAAASQLLPGARSFADSWQWWAASGSVGNLLVTPFLVVWAAWVRGPSKVWTRQRALEGAALITFVALANFALFSALASHKLFLLFLPYTTFPFLLWAALRFTVRGVSTVLLIVMAISVLFIAGGGIAGLSGVPGMVDDVIVIQMFLVVLAIPALIMAAVVSERESVELETRRSRDLIEAVIEGTSDAIYAKDGQGCYTLLNLAAAGYLGKSASEVIGRDDMFMFPRDEARAVIDADRAVMASGRTQTYEETVTTASDGLTTFLVTKGPLLDNGGNVYGLFGVSRDITERKRAEQALLESKALTDAIIENAPLMIFVKEAKDLRYVTLNRAGEELVGYDRSDVLGKNCLDVFPPEQAAHFIANDREVLDGDVQVLDIPEEPIQTAKKGLRLLHTRKVCIRDSDGNTKYLLGISEDITERKQREEMLRQSEERYRTAFKTSPDAVNINRLSDGRYIEVNDGFTRLVGWTSDEVVGRTSREINIWKDMADRQRLVEALQRDSSCPNLEADFVAKDGKVIRALMSAHTMMINGELCILSVTRDITERKTAEEKIQNLAFSDSLTGLPNRRFLMERIEKVFAISARHHRQAALMLADLDNFKTLNDTLGHHQGDLVLQQVAKRLIHCLRESDTVVRLGGDEFVILLEDLSGVAEEAASQAKTAADKILEALGQPHRFGNSEQYCTASIGITLFGDRTEDTSDPLKRADLAMYQAKVQGHGSLRFFDPQMQIAINARAALEVGLREAWLKNQFLLHYQAQIDDQGQVTGAEALLRWQHPERGLVAPAEFIDTAEVTGLIVPLGAWVLESACAQLALWTERGEMTSLTISVNVSARQFHQDDFVDLVRTTLERSGAKSHLLKLELTESVLITDIEAMIVKMNALKGLGVCFSLDDFGTGYSSLAYLKRLPLDELKIDKGFVRDILVNPDDVAIARMIIALSESLGLRVIAEGVETQAQRNILAGLNCRNFQGYLFSMPVPIDEFELLAKRV